MSDSLFPYFFLPVIYIFVGLLTPKCKHIGPVGYRTPRSMKNQKNWDFAQKLSGKYMLILGSVILLINVLFYFAIFPLAHFQLWNMIAITGGTLLVIAYTELRLYQFEKNKSH